MRLPPKNEHILVQCANGRRFVVINYPNGGAALACVNSLTGATEHCK
jgi:hypothetical protein